MRCNLILEGTLSSVEGMIVLKRPKCEIRNSVILAFQFTGAFGQAEMAKNGQLREAIAAKCEFFVESQLWPLQQEFNPDGWLGNFSADEAEYAIHLLDSFMYFSDALTRQLYQSAFRMLAGKVCDVRVSKEQFECQWEGFKCQLIVTRVQGDPPSEADSAYIFSRMARQELGIDENQLLAPEAAVQILHAGKRCNVLFVDDFVGSGDQFVDTWKRPYEIQNGVETSFESLLRGSTNRAFYCPIVCADLGRKTISEQCPEAVLSPAHFLDDRYSVFSERSIVWPENLRSSATAFIKQASDRAQITQSWKGYRNQGLLIAFQHSVPDATIPLVYHESDAWIPLIRRK